MMKLSSSNERGCRSMIKGFVPPGLNPAKPHAHRYHSTQYKENHTPSLPATTRMAALSTSSDCVFQDKMAFSTVLTTYYHRVLQEQIHQEPSMQVKDRSRGQYPEGITVGQCRWSS